MKIKLFVFCLCVSCTVSVYAQSHISVHLESQVYYILEQAAMRGLCAPLSGVRPYTQSVIAAAISEILDEDNEEKLRGAEREILQQYLERFSKPEAGMDWSRGGWYGEKAIGSNDAALSLDIGITADIEGSAGIYNSFDERYFGTEFWGGISGGGDIGRRVSWQISAEGGIFLVPRNYLGKYNTYYEGFQDRGEFINRPIDIYTQPLTYLPYAYTKRWDGSVYYLSSLSGLKSWPDSFSGGYGLLSELTASFWENKLILRLGRLSREWGQAPLGSSLVLNHMARPFLGIEAEFSPVSWFSLVSMTGFLEYYNAEGIKTSSRSFQNAYSITMLQFRYKNYLFFDLFDAVVYPKRFEPGYIVPIVSNFLYQNNVGDFDNIAMGFNLRAQIPNIGNFWFSAFIDEMDVNRNMAVLDRTMNAYQAGIAMLIPALAFSSVKFSYTRVNPYCYTHNRNFNPWYGDVPMETSYTNNGVGLGYYLPPNSDEIMVRFQTMPIKNLTTNLQYQMIRRGADFGTSAVDGSNLLSELDPWGRDTNPILKRFFLRDGAYQWMHIVKIGADWKLPKLPIALFGEAGVNFSYFTNIAEEANVTGKAHPYSRINTSEYPESAGYIFRLGVKVYPR